MDLNINNLNNIRRRNGEINVSLTYKDSNGIDHNASIGVNFAEIGSRNDAYITNPIEERLNDIRKQIESLVRRR